MPSSAPSPRPVLPTRALATVAIALCVSTAACKRDPPDEPTDDASSKPSPDDGTEAFADKAHAAALARAKTLAQRALASADPLSAFSCDLGPLGPPHVSATTLRETKPLADEAWKEVQAIDERRLLPADRVALQVIRFGLRRIDLHARERPPTRTDPGFAMLGAERTVVAVELQWARGACSQCAAALASVAEELDAAALDLGAASRPALAAAQHDLERIADRIAALGARATDFAAACTASAVRIREIAGRLGDQLAALPDAPTTTWDARPPPAMGKPTLARLPDRMGADALRRHLAREEASAQPLDVAATQLWSTIDRLDAMRDKYGDADVDAGSIVDIPRCETAIEAVSAWTNRSGTTVEDAPDCEALQRLMHGQALTDAALLVEVLRRTWVDPLATQRRRATGRAVALIGGDIAPASQRLMSTIAATTGMKQRAAAARAIDDAKRAACLAATTLAVHGELGDEAQLRDRLGETCPERKPDAWIEAAVARPVAALFGLGLAFVESGPASAAMLDRYPWAPLGLIPVLASPPPPDPALPEPKIEQLQP